jgi:small multidrug resistance pump
MQKNWLNTTLKLAAVYNIVWGAVVVLFPNLLFEIAGLELPKYDMIWQSVGMIVGVYGIGYWIASRDYVRHWPVVLVGYLGKIFGPIGIFYQVAFCGFPKTFLVVTLFNDLIWLIPFTLMVREAYKTHQFKV